MQVLDSVPYPGGMQAQLSPWIEQFVPSSQPQFERGSQTPPASGTSHTHSPPSQTRSAAQAKPHEPQFELYELDLREVRTLEDIDRMLGDVRRTLNRYPGDMRVEERAVNMVGNVIPLMGRMCDQLTDQLGKIVDQVRRLPNYQINWPAVREVMRDLLKEFQKLRRITGKCLPLVTSDEHKRIIRDLIDHIERKMEACRSMGA